MRSDASVDPLGDVDGREFGLGLRQLLSRALQRGPLGLDVALVLLECPPFLRELVGRIRQLTSLCPVLEVVPSRAELRERLFELCHRFLNCGEPLCVLLGVRDLLVERRPFGPERLYLAVDVLDVERGLEERRQILAGADGPADRVLLPETGEQPRTHLVGLVGEVRRAGLRNLPAGVPLQGHLVGVLPSRERHRAGAGPLGERRTVVRPGRPQHGPDRGDEAGLPLKVRGLDHVQAGLEGGGTRTDPSDVLDLQTPHSSMFARSPLSTWGYHRGRDEGPPRVR